MTTPSPTRWAVWLNRLSWAATAVLLGVLVWRLTPKPTDGAGTAAPPLAVVTLDGQPQTLVPGGDVLVLNVWATWCPPCRAEMPGLAALARDLGPRSRQTGGVRVVGLSVDEAGAAAVRPFLARHPLPYPVVFDAGALAVLGSPEVVPTTVVFDRAGRVRLRHAGFVVPATLRPLLRRLLAEPSPGSTRGR